MPFPEAIAEAQRRAIADRLFELESGVEDLMRMLRDGQPHLFNLGSSDYYALIESLVDIQKGLALAMDQVGR